MKKKDMLQELSN